MKVDVLVYEIPANLRRDENWRTHSNRRNDLDFQVDAKSLSEASDLAREKMRDGKVICITRFFRDQCVQLYFQ